MFTPDGRVREEFAALEEEAASAPQSDTEVVTASQPSSEAPTASPTPELEPPPAREATPHLELPGAPPGLGPGFLDLVAVLADPVPFYLGDKVLPDGQTIENLEMARLHIDLLDVLRQRTAGNLTAVELRELEALLYQLRMSYVQKRR